jgi:hypothetical protein
MPIKAALHLPERVFVLPRSNPPLLGHGAVRAKGAGGACVRPVHVDVLPLLLGEVCQRSRCAAEKGRSVWIPMQSHQLRGSSRFIPGVIAALTSHPEGIHPAGLLRTALPLR